MPASFYEDVADALRGFLRPPYRDFAHLARSQNLKVWFAEPREHYEVQHLGRSVLRAAGITGASTALEIGFHAEHPSPAANDEVLARLGRAWRSKLGRDAVAGPFIGRREVADRWRRLSELWDGPNLDGIEAAIEAAERLAVYIATVEPLRTGSVAPTKARRTSRPGA